MQQAGLEEKSGAGTTRFIVECQPGSILGALLQGLVEQYFGEDCDWRRSQEPHSNDVAVVTNQHNGQALWVFLHPRPGAVVPPVVSAIHLASSRSDVEQALESLITQVPFICNDLRANTHPTLTAREREVALLVAEGFGNAQIATALSVSPHTVRAHLRAISVRLGVNSRARLAAAVRDLKL